MAVCPWLGGVLKDWGSPVPQSNNHLFLLCTFYIGIGSEETLDFSFCAILRLLICQDLDKLSESVCHFIIRSVGAGAFMIFYSNALTFSDYSIYLLFFPAIFNQL